MTVRPHLRVVPQVGWVTKCRFRLVHQQGRGSNRKAIYMCQSHPYPSGCLPHICNPFKVTK